MSILIVALISALVIHLLYSYDGEKSEDTSLYIKCVIVVMIAVLLMSILKVGINNEMPDMNRYIQRINGRNIRRENN
jgi:hypothetical protein